MTDFGPKDKNRTKYVREKLKMLSPLCYTIGPYQQTPHDFYHVMRFEKDND